MGSIARHPKGLYVLFATEMWERFNYYGLRAILVLFMTKVLLFDKILASSIYGSYTSLVFLSPLLGGFIADKFWGNKKSIIAGGLTMAIGELMLFVCASKLGSIPSNEMQDLTKNGLDLNLMYFFIGLGFMIGGNGFFKANISSLVGQLYAQNDSRKDAAYTIFYMGINLGGALGPYICGLVGDTGRPEDFKWGFLAGGIGMLLSVVVQLLFHKKYVKDPNGKVLGLQPENCHKSMKSIFIIPVVLVSFSLLSFALLYIDSVKFSYLFFLLLACTLGIAFIVFSDTSLNKLQKKKVLVIFIVSFFVIFFWSCFEQAGVSLTFFTNEQTDRTLHFGTKIFEIPTSWFQSVNSFFIIIFAFIFAWMWGKLGKRGPNAYVKMAIGLFILSLSFIWLAFGTKGISPGVKVSMLWIVGVYLMHTWGELLLSPIGLSLVNNLSPLKYSSLLMAVWFTSNASANKLAGVLSALYPEPNPTKLLGFHINNLFDFFLVFMVLAGIAGIILLLLSKKLQQLATE